MAETSIKASVIDQGINNNNNTNFNNNNINNNNFNNNNIVDYNNNNIVGENSNNVNNTTTKTTVPNKFVSNQAENEKEESTEKLPFFSGNPDVEIVNGVIHLYRDKHGSLPDHFTLPV